MQKEQQRESTHFYVLSLHNSLGSFCIFPAPFWDWAFLQETLFFLVENGETKIYVLDVLCARCANCYWIVVGCKSTQLTEPRNICTFINLCMYITIKISICTHLCLHYAKCEFMLQYSTLIHYHIDRYNLLSLLICKLLL